MLSFINPCFYAFFLCYPLYFCLLNFAYLPYFSFFFFKLSAISTIFQNNRIFLLFFMYLVFLLFLFLNLFLFLFIYFYSNPAYEFYGYLNSLMFYNNLFLSGVIFFLIFEIEFSFSFLLSIGSNCSYFYILTFLVMFYLFFILFIVYDAFCCISVIPSCYNFFFTLGVLFNFILPFSSLFLLIVLLAITFFLILLSVFLLFLRSYLFLSRFSYFMMTFTRI